MRTKTKRVIMTVWALAAALLLVSCGGNTAETTALPETAVTEAATTTVEATDAESEAPQAEEGVGLTLEELTEYDGKDGRPAYVAIDGIIYDMTDVAAWENGLHNGNEAGQDLTEVLTGQSPHGDTVLADLPVVGFLVEE